MISLILLSTTRRRWGFFFVRWRLLPQVFQYDEWVPSTMDTAKQGYYVNKGVLEFRQIDTGTNSSDDSSDSEQPKKRKRKVLVEEEDDVDDVVEEEEVEVVGASENMMQPAPVFCGTTGHQRKAGKSRRKKVGFLYFLLINSIKHGYLSH